MNRKADTGLFLIGVAVTAWLAHSSAGWMPPERRAWMCLAAGVAAVVGLPGGLCYGVLLKGLLLALKPPTGRALLFVRACGLLLLAAGLGMLFAATGHRMAGAPPYVWVTWILLGGYTCLTYGLLLRAAGRLKQEGEMRRLQAHDISSA